MPRKVTPRLTREKGDAKRRRENAQPQTAKKAIAKEDRNNEEENTALTSVDCPAKRPRLETEGIFVSPSTVAGIRDGDLERPPRNMTPPIQFMISQIMVSDQDLDEDDNAPEQNILCPYGVPSERKFPDARLKSKTLIFFIYV